MQGAELQAKMRKEIANAPIYATTAVKALPSVLLGCLLNILDGVSCKFSVFPFLFSLDIFGIGFDPMVPWLSFHLCEIFSGRKTSDRYAGSMVRCGVDVAPGRVNQDLGTLILMCNAWIVLPTIPGY